MDRIEKKVSEHYNVSLRLPNHGDPQLMLGLGPRICAGSSANLSLATFDCETMNVAIQ